MERTGQYQLSHWQKSDRILMDDFNADNTKIDAALAANAAAISAEKATREAAAAAEEAARKSADAAEEAGRRNADAAEEAARKNADAALQSSIITTNPIARVMDVITTASANQVNLTIGNIDWNAYAQVFFYADIKGAGGMAMTVNGWTDKIYMSTPGGSTMTLEYLLYENSLATEGSLFTGTIPCAKKGFGINWSYTSRFGIGATYIGQSYVANNSWVKPRGEYSTLNFTTNGQIYAGSRFVMMGVKL
ncbi:hypothetical protein [Oscillibacter sp. GMB15532]|uniref:hypothetical protein n=1 Tax=Oscillibacter sp. GMB15532 TaxID=3230022 RepID=UPI0034DED643